MNWLADRAGSTANAGKCIVTADMFWCPSWVVPSTARSRLPITSVTEARVFEECSAWGGRPLLALGRPLSRCAVQGEGQPISVGHQRLDDFVGQVGGNPVSPLPGGRHLVSDDQDSRLNW